MFSKDNEQMESFIGSGTEFQGRLNVKGTLRVDGQFDGKLNAAWVILGETGVIKGEVSAKKIIIGGRAEGILRVQEIVEIKATGKFLGEIFSKKSPLRKGQGSTEKLKRKWMKTGLLNSDQKRARVKMPGGWSCACRDT